MAVDTERRAKKNASRLEHSLLLQPVTNAMSYSPPNHSPEDSAHVADGNFAQSPVPHIQPKSTVPGEEPDHQSQLLSSKKRRSSKSKVPGELRRSTSTPHMRHLALGNSGELSPTSNKARNKLGYHRTSVACGHCRRRKIRCLLAPDDPQGRCANCIRLKKECNFYPVEQNPDAPFQPMSTKDTAPLTPAASSPRHSTSVSGDKMGEFRAPYHSASSATPNNAYSFQNDPDMEPHQGPTPGRMPVQHPSYPYPHPIDTQWPPAATFLPSSTITESPASSTSYWRQSPSTANTVYSSESNVSSVHTPTAMSTSSTMSFNHPDNQTWGPQPPFQPPTRSMSYGNIEGLSQPYPGQGLGIHQDFPRRTPPYPYPTSIDTNSAVIQATTAVGNSIPTPLSAPAMPNHYYPPSWNAYEGVQNQGPQMQMTGRSMSVQWYPESGHLDRVQEEGAPVGFAPQSMQQFYSGA